MKRMTTIIVFTICVLAIGSLSYAQGRGRGYGVSASNTGRGMYFVDKDGDGICDNAGLRGNVKGRGQGRQFRVKNVPGNASVHGPRYIDKNRDGVCDNFELNQDKTE